MRRALFGYRLAVAVAFLGALSPSAEISAAGSPETTLVVVNAASPLSQRIANEYVRLRGIPDTHLVRLSGVPSSGKLPMAAFRQKVWAPIRDYIREHGLEDEIDVIAYSGDFPYAVDFKSDVAAHDLPADRHRGDTASLTGLTYFARRVEADDVGYLGVNHYFREFVGPQRLQRREAPGSARLSDEERKALGVAAEKALQRKDYDEATDHYLRLLASHPEVAGYWYGLARARAGRGSPDEALEALTAAVDRGWVGSLRMRREAEFAPLRGHAGFQSLLERLETAYGPFESPHGFRHRYVWSNSDLAFWQPADVLDQYYLSTMLAYTGARGNSLPEVIDYLNRAAASDGTHPDGVVYLMENSNVRSDTRQPLFPAAVAELARRGRRAEILGAGPGRACQRGIVPLGRDDVVGAVIGASQYDWTQSDSRLLPGAIAESLTSYGGDFDNSAQTKLSASLRHGAAGSSGAVAEPYAIQAKFPLPLLHAYYADGCSLAEAFYQSVLAPYQLIVVGDPLARPFARFAAVGLKAPDVSTVWSGTVRVEPTVRPAEGTTVRAVELWVDGQHVASGPVDAPIDWDTRSVEDGSHDVRLVAVEDSVIETRSVFRASVSVFNRERRVAVDAATADVRYGEPVELAGRAEGATRVELRRGHQVLARAEVKEGRWSLTVPSDALGMGTVPVVVRAAYPDGHAVRSAPVVITVREPALLAAVTLDTPVGQGLRAVVRDKAGTEREVVVERLAGTIGEITKAGVTPESMRLTGFVNVGKPGVYQFVIRSNGWLRVAAHDRVLMDEAVSQEGAERFVVVGLEAGWHPIEIELKPGGKKPFLKVVIAGDQVPDVLGKGSLAHR